MNESASTTTPARGGRKRRPQSELGSMGSRSDEDEEEYREGVAGPSGETLTRSNSSPQMRTSISIVTTSSKIMSSSPPSRTTIRIKQAKPSSRRTTPRVLTTPAPATTPAQPAQTTTQQHRRQQTSASKSLFAFMPGEKDFAKPKLRPPDFTKIAPEPARLHTYDVRGASWKSEEMMVRVDPTAFATGGARRAHYMVVEDEVRKPLAQGQYSGRRRMAEPTLLVTKFVDDMAMDSPDSAERLHALCMQDVEQQMLSKHYAGRYNRYKPPRDIDFLDCGVLELCERGPRERYCGVEQYVFGHYCKWNTAFGYVSEVVRCTPAAFAHFTFEASRHTAVVTDIRVVGDVFSDPIVHTKETQGAELFSGNLGADGIEQFLMTHQCNVVCKALCLKALSPWRVIREQARLRSLIVPGDSDSDEDESAGGDRRGHGRHRRCSSSDDSDSVGDRSDEDDDGNERDIRRYGTIQEGEADENEEDRSFSTSATGSSKSPLLHRQRANSRRRRHHSTSSTDSTVTCCVIT